MNTNTLEINAYRYWAACKTIDNWTDTATIVLCHLLQQDNPILRARAQDLSRRVQAAKNDGWEIYEEQDEPA
jgi:hypothetical protein